MGFQCPLVTSWQQTNNKWVGRGQNVTFQNVVLDWKGKKIFFSRTFWYLKDQTTDQLIKKMNPEWTD